MNSKLSIRIKLFFILGLLGLVPVAAAVLALQAVREETAADQAAHKALQNTLYLERINALVYAVVVENRGIYLSSEGWANIERFTTNMTTHLAGISKLTAEWRKDVVAAEAVSVDKLAAMEKIAHNVQQASIGTAGVAASVAKVQRTAAGSNACANQVLTSARELAGQSEKLHSEVNKFLTRVRAAR